MLALVERPSARRSARSRMSLRSISASSKLQSVEDAARAVDVADVDVAMDHVAEETAEDAVMVHSVAVVEAIVEEIAEDAAVVMDHHPEVHAVELQEEPVVPSTQPTPVLSRPWAHKSHHEHIKKLYSMACSSSILWI